MKCVVLTSPGEIVECAIHAKKLGYEVEIYPTTRSETSLLDTYYEESASYINRSPESAERRHVRSLRASFIRALRDARYSNDEDIIFCESDAVPTISASELKNLAQTTLLKYSEADILRPFKHCEWRHGLSSVNEVPSEAAFVRMKQFPDRDPCTPAFWGTHALIVPKRSRERLARVFAEYRLPTDVALALANGKGIISVYTCTHNFFYQIQRERKPNPFSIAGILHHPNDLNILRHQIRNILTQDYDNFHLFVAAPGINDSELCADLYASFQSHPDKRCLTICTQEETNRLFSFDASPLKQYDLLAFLSSNAAYTRDYVSYIAKYHEALPPGSCSIYEGGSALSQREANCVASFVVPSSRFFDSSTDIKSFLDVNTSSFETEIFDRTTFVDVQRAYFSRI